MARARARARVLPLRFVYPKKLHSLLGIVVVLFQNCVFLGSSITLIRFWLFWHTGGVGTVAGARDRPGSSDDGDRQGEGEGRVVARLGRPAHLE